MNRFYVRKFLNRRGHHGAAYVHAVVEDTTAKDDPDYYTNIRFELADCSRQISLDFPMWTAADRENSVRKARLLTEALAEFADALAVEADLSAKRAKRRRPKHHDVSMPLEEFLDSTT